jgi:hypothetical protein
MPGQRFIVIAAAFVLLLVVALVRKRRLSESLSMFWLTFAALMVAAATFGFPYLIEAASLIGVVYAPSALFLVAILFLLAFNLYLSVEVSELSEQNKILAQEVGLLRLGSAGNTDEHG